MSNETRDRSSLRAAAVVLAALLGSYGPNLMALGREWSYEPNYSHGFLVGPIALAILWLRRDRLADLTVRPNGLGWVLLVLVLLARVWLFERNELWVENATLLVALVGLVLAFGGWPLLRWAGPAIAFLVFMLPLPPRLNMTLAGPLQQLATLGSTTLLRATGLPVLAQGNVILIGSDHLEVAQACNGLSMLLSFITLVTAIVLLLGEQRSPWERGLLMLSAIPIALVANILRIAATAWTYHLLGAERGEKLAHDAAGWLMMPIALVLILAEMKLLSWLIVEEQPLPERRLVLSLAQRAAGSGP
jgi:exosortase